MPTVDPVGFLVGELLARTSAFSLATYCKQDLCVLANAYSVANADLWSLGSLSTDVEHAVLRLLPETIRLELVMARGNVGAPSDPSSQLLKQTHITWFVLKGS